MFGVGVSAIHIMPKTLIPDSIDYGRAHNGLQAEATYFGIQSFIEKLATSIAVSATGVFLAQMGYISAKGDAFVVQPASALLAIKLTISVIPAVFILAGALLALYYPITRDSYKVIRDKISEGEASND